MRRALLVVAVVFGLVLATGCEPEMTITASTDTAVGCGQYSDVTGKVTPASATAKVFLQRTVGGKWRDYTNPSDPKKAKVSAVVGSNGKYSIAYEVPESAGTYHLRVRSSGSGTVSPSLWPTAHAYDTGQCV